MDATIVVSSLALIVTILGWYFTWYQQKKILELQRNNDIETELRSELQEKVIKVHAHLDKYARLNDLWRRKSGFSFRRILEDKKGNPIPIENSKLEEKYFLSEEDEEEAIKQMEGVTFDSLIAQTKVSILLASGEIGDILAEIDPSKGLNERLTKMYFECIYKFDNLYKNPKSWNVIHTSPHFANLFENSTKLRQELRSELDKIVKEKIKNHVVTSSKSVLRRIFH